MFEHVYIIIPAKDEAPRLRRVLKEIFQLGFKNVVVVDDGSKDNTGAIALEQGATLLTHAVNLGPGAATQTGVSYALALNAEIIVTIDADAQHDTSHIQKLLEPIEVINLDVVIGSRFISPQPGIPVSRILYNRIANIFTFLYTGILLTDSQSGFKAMHRRFAKHIHIKFNGFEFCTEFIGMMKKHSAKYKEVPVRVIYSRETMEKGQSFLNGIKMLFSFLRREL